MNWLAEFLVLIIVGLVGMIAIRIPLVMFSSFQNNHVGNMYLQIFVGFAVFGVFLFQAIRVVRKNLSEPFKQSLVKNKQKIIPLVIGLAIFSILFPAGYIIDDVRYGQCFITTSGTMTGGSSYNLLSLEQDCKQGCVLSGKIGVSTDRTVQCIFNGLGYSWSATADSYSTIDEDSLKP